MSDAAVERLNRLQEDDLGTNRRERVSTIDREFRETRMEVIEASRRSNIPGTAEQQVALAKQAELAAWANFHRVIGDTGDQEELDPLLNGQSHRLKLNESQGGRTHSSGPTGRGNASSTNVSQRIPAFHSGLMHTSNGVSSAGPSTRRPSHRAISTGSQAPRGLDPALNRDNFSDRPRRCRPAGNLGSSAHRFPSLKNRRPLGNFSQVISSPEEFLAAARGMVSTRQSPKEAPSEPKSQETPMEQSTATASNSVSPKSPSVVPPPENLVTPNQQTPTTPLDKRKTLGDAVPEEPHKNIPSTGELSEDQRKPDKNPQSSAANGEHTVPVTRPPKAVGILLDFNCATPDNLVAEPGQSPALEELKGLEFMQFSQSQSSLSSAASNANRRLDFGGLLPTKRNPFEQEVAETATEYSDEELAAEYKREIRTICQLLEPPSLSEMFVLRITGLKKELESSLRLLAKESNPQVPGSPNPGSHERQSVSRSVASPSRLTFDAKGPVTVFPATAHETPKHSRHSSLSTPSSQSRLRGAAPQFQPGTLTNFRTVSSATSTGSSTSFHSTVTNAQSDTPTPGAANAPTPDAETIKARFAANMRRAMSGGQVPLPGKAENVPKRNDRPGKSHIIGDHLLPGRRVASSAPKGPGVAPYPQSVLAEAAAPKPSPTTFTLPSPPRPVKTPNLNTASREKETAKDAAQKAYAPQFDSASGSLCLKPNNVAAPPPPTKTQRSSEGGASMMESIYAPKPKPTAAQSSTDNKKPPTSRGLEASRYSDPQWL